ncbi:MAG: tRNA pseudouridine(38-40) synthase TruA [Chloroflexi bacterium]|nr:tRNA pseudouridine(38-40) synthase TruA [Chloroflexota bacterium]
MRAPGRERELALLVEYEGTAYQGFQVQHNGPTVQGALERALQQLTRQYTKTSGASRTDAGVHAKGQVVAFRTTAPYPPESFVRALNFYLPEDIRVQQAHEVAGGFDPRRDAFSREYGYLITNAPQPSALWRRFAEHVPQPLDVEAMRRAGKALVGVHDFAAFSGPMEHAGASTHRCVLRAQVARRGPLVVLVMEANAFLPHQVRRTAGALVQVGLGKQSVEGFRELLHRGEPGKAAPSLPARGVCLVRVRYRDFPPRQGAGEREQG